MTLRTLPEVAERLPGLLDQAHSALGAGASELTLEFILPRNLISHDVDQWEIDRDFPHSIGTSYPVVVRSLDRLSKRKLHSPWLQKWRWLQENGHREDAEAVYWLASRGTLSPRSVRANLLLEPSLVALAMAFPPEDTFDLTTDELTAALYAGVSVVLWCRGEIPHTEFERDVRALLSGHGLAELPAQVLRLRQKADQIPDSSRPLGSHLTLLWDDADRIPASFTRSVRLQAPR